jgi:hypothetical protein
MIAFAANSVLGRMAIAPGPFGSGGLPLIDPASYSAIRLGSGAVMLVLLVAVTRTGAGRSPRLQSGSWASAFALFAYAVAFSYAYVALDTGVGALILFACVQATMIGWSLKEGDRPSPLEWLGLIVAFAAFIWLVSPGLAAPDPLAAAAMAASGIAWGAYSLKGRGLPDPLKATADNFTRSVAFVIPLFGVVLMAQLPVHASANGVMLAIAIRRCHLGPGLCALVPRAQADRGNTRRNRATDRAGDRGDRRHAVPGRGLDVETGCFVAADPGRCGAGDHRQAKAALKSDPFPALAQLVGQRQRDAVLKGFAVGIDAR